MFKRFFPSLSSTDIKAAPHLDRVVNAQEIPFPDGSVRAFHAIHCFHHFPRPELFFGELRRRLAPAEAAF